MDSQQCEIQKIPCVKWIQFVVLTFAVEWYLQIRLFFTQTKYVTDPNLSVVVSNNQGAPARKFLAIMLSPINNSLPLGCKSFCAFFFT